MKDKENVQKKTGQEISCALHGSPICPKPNECDGINRQCRIWQSHSGR
ncbi:MAG: hypothetical protein HFJ28_00225 [Clostridia bacterium]|nr:hypothetical protein [Clostridia bacterium]